MTVSYMIYLNKAINFEGGWKFLREAADPVKSVPRNWMPLINPILTVDLSYLYLIGFQKDLKSLDEDHPYRARIKEKEFQAKRKHVNITKVFKEWSDKIFRHLLKPYCNED